MNAKAKKQAEKIIESLSLEQKCALLSGGGEFETRSLPQKGIPAMVLSDGPNGVRRQAGASDHLGLNPSLPATCFPTAVTVANSWDPALGEAIGRRSVCMLFFGGGFSRVHSCLVPVACTIMTENGGSTGNWV